METRNQQRPYRSVSPAEMYFVSPKFVRGIIAERASYRPQGLVHNPLTRVRQRFYSLVQALVPIVLLLNVSQ